MNRRGFNAVHIRQGIQVDRVDFSNSKIEHSVIRYVTFWRSWHLLFSGFVNLAVDVPLFRRGTHYINCTNFMINKAAY